MTSPLSIDALVALAAHHGASDLHVQAGLPVTLRVRGELHALGEPVAAQIAEDLVRQVLGTRGLAELDERRSVDRARVLADVRCRVNVLHSTRGLGMALRLLARRTPTIATLNLHPELRRLVRAPHGLVLVTGPTGSGKSSTLAAMVEEINATRACHVLTVEQPVEFVLEPKKAFIRQREVGRDTPSFEQALHDALREDIDVLMVGEMRDRSTMRLTLDACETGHLVLATLHSSTPSDALQRIVSAFPAEEQASVCAQLADVLVAVVTQGLGFRDALGIRVPECEILLGTTAARSIVRQGQFFKLVSAMETGAGQGMWTRARYRRWLDERTEWHLPEVPPLPRAADLRALYDAAPTPPAPRVATEVSRPHVDDDEPPDDDVIVLEPPVGDVKKLLDELEDA